MYTNLADRLSIVPEDWSSWLIEIPSPPALLFRHSQPVAVQNFNAASFDATAYHFDRGSGVAPEGDVYIDLQGSNDLENWKTLLDAEAAEGIVVGDEGYYTSTMKTDVTFAYLRLQYRVFMSEDSFQGGAGASSCVLSTGIELIEE